MPLYEYSCKECNHHFETLVRSDTKVTCPACESESVEKQLSVFAVKGGSGPSMAQREARAAACGGCGDPRGPGACMLDN